MLRRASSGVVGGRGDPVGAVGHASREALVDVGSDQLHGSHLGASFAAQRAATFRAPSWTPKTALRLARRLKRTAKRVASRRWWKMSSVMPCAAARRVLAARP